MPNQKIAAVAASGDGRMTLAELARFVRAAYEAEIPPDDTVLVVQCKGLTTLRIARIETDTRSDR